MGAPSIFNLAQRVDGCKYIFHLNIQTKMEGELGLLRGNVIHSINITSTNPSNKKYKKTNIYLLLKIHPLSFLAK